MKEIEFREGTSLGTTNKLEFAPRPKPVIRTSTKKVFTQPPAFGDTKENMLQLFKILIFLFTLCIVFVSPKGIKVGFFV
jgi:hypothetical protein